ncbi:MAG TPA: hypothetical protein VHW72_18875 [Candidatus Angelobacter sp.]|nr:hypothetical protein [Candidatus Angelobacter sp.]
MGLVQDRMHTSAQDKPDAVQSLPASWWEGLCCWLTTNLKDMEMTLERREGDGEWKMECLSHPLESVTTHRTPNGVQILSINVGVNGKSRVFQIAGPSSIMLYKDTAGFPIRVEISSQSVQTVLCFSGPLEPAEKHSSNAWGE